VTWQSILADAVLAVAVLVVVASSIGVLAMRDTYQKVHFVTPITLVGPALVAVAVTLRAGWSEPTGQTWLAIAVICIAGPVLSHATVRAVRVRQRGDWRDREDVVPVENQT
jgi:monovalent cation/proton antiporter MnhG/PhaG subunit